MPRKQIRRMNFCSNSKTFDKSNLYNNYLTKGTDFTCCLDAYKTEHDAGSMYSFTLLQVGANRFVINLPPSFLGNAHKITSKIEYRGLF